uniref:Uncharacterized protein n=1 Tax=Lepeophtheirus salmonis TaxID=72036 RepID=A0A0K2T2J1_LEPSM
MLNSKSKSPSHSNSLVSSNEIVCPCHHSISLKSLFNMVRLEFPSKYKLKSPGINQIKRQGRNLFTWMAH